MKRQIYIALFMLLGLLISFLVHAAAEIFAISILLRDFERWSFGLSWPALLRIHNIGSVVLSAAGLWIGYAQGRYWWLYVYKFDGRRKHSG